MISQKLLLPIALLAGGCHTALFAQTPSLKLVLPERVRLLEGQYLDLVLEVRNATAISNLSVRAGNIDLTARFSRPESTHLDCDTSSDLVLRADLQSFATAGTVKVTASAMVGGVTVSDSCDIVVRLFLVLMERVETDPNFRIRLTRIGGDYEFLMKPERRSQEILRFLLEL